MRTAMKKHLCFLFSIMTCFTFASCQAANSSTTPKTDLTAENFSEYFSVEIIPEIDDLSISRFNNIPLGMSGNGTIKVKIYPTQPLKCYSSSATLTIDPPFTWYGVKAIFTDSNNMTFNFNADGESEQTAEITIESTDTDSFVLGYSLVDSFTKEMEKHFEKGYTWTVTETTGQISII